MAWLQVLRDRKAVVFCGMALALLAGLAIAFLMISRDRGAQEAPPASQGGLVVQTGRDDDIKLDARRPLRRAHLVANRIALGYETHSHDPHSS